MIRNRISALKFWLGDRNLLLYPAELQAHALMLAAASILPSCSQAVYISFALQIVKECALLDNCFFTMATYSHDTDDINYQNGWINSIDW
ncbi:hypothetical protein WN093_04675 [Gammaproteobacteria bacterium AS21]